MPINRKIHRSPSSTPGPPTNLQESNEEEEDVGVAAELLEQELGQEREDAVLGRGDTVGHALVGRLLLVDVDSAGLGHRRRAGLHRARVLICGDGEKGVTGGESTYREMRLHTVVQV